MDVIYALITINQNFYFPKYNPMSSLYIYTKTLHKSSYTIAERGQRGGEIPLYFCSDAFGIFRKMFSKCIENYRNISKLTIRAHKEISTNINWRRL